MYLISVENFTSMTGTILLIVFNKVTKRIVSHIILIQFYHLAVSYNVRMKIKRLDLHIKLYLYENVTIPKMRKTLSPFGYCENYVKKYPRTCYPR